MLVEQSVDVALELADRAYFLEKGEVRFAGPIADLRSHPELVRAVFLGETVSASTMPRSTSSARSADTARLGVQGITQHYGGLLALDDVTFAVGDREIVGVLGPNGAGKTTLFDVISGFLGSDGAVTLDGTDVTALTAHQRARLGLGRSFQDGRLFPALTVRETIAVAASVRSGFATRSPQVSTSRWCDAPKPR